MADRMKEIEAWADLTDKTDDEMTQIRIREYIDLLMDNKMDLKSSKIERGKMTTLLNGLRDGMNTLLNTNNK